MFSSEIQTKQNPSEFDIFHNDINHKIHMAERVFAYWLRRMQQVKTAKPDEKQFLFEIEHYPGGFRTEKHWNDYVAFIVRNCENARMDLKFYKRRLKEIEKFRNLM